MRRKLTYGLLILACGAFASACGDDDDLRSMLVGTAGSSAGGMSGATGNAGGAGGRGGNPAGVGGAGGAGPAPTFPASCAGCVELNVPLDPTSVSRQGQFLFRPAMPVDMSAATVTWRVKAVTPVTEIPGELMYVATFAQNGMALNYAGSYGAQVLLTPANGFTSPETWVDVTMNLPALGVAPPAVADAGAGDGGLDGGGPPDPPAVTPVPAGFDRTLIFQYGLYVGSLASAPAGTVRVAVDSVTYEGGSFTNVEFTADAQGLTSDDYMRPVGTTLVHRP